MRWLLKIRDWWWRRQRNIDLNVLWPECKRQCKDNLDHARGIFAVHAFQDPCWIEFYGEDRLKKFIDHLE